MCPLVRPNREPDAGCRRPRHMTPTRPAIGLVVLLAAGLAGCGQQTGSNGGASPSTPASGVSGTVTVDGGCPVVRPDQPCPDQPLQAIIAVTRPGSSSVLAKLTSDASGRFRIPLEPGSYVLHPANTTGAVVPRAVDQTVHVPDGHFINITIHFDSGIRGAATSG